MTAKEYKKLRESLGTQEEVAELLGVSRGIVAGRETATADIHGEAACALRWLGMMKGIDAARSSWRIGRLMASPSWR